MSTFSQRILADTDDGCKIGSDSWHSDYRPMFGKYDDINTVTAGIRFTNVTVPQGSTISSAYLTFTARYTNTDTVLTKVYGIDQDDTASMSSDPTGRTKTTAAVDWDSTNHTQNTAYQSPDIKTIVQEIVDRAGWSSGNDMGFLLLDDGSDDYCDNVPYDHEGDSSKAFLLTINYTEATTSTSSTTSSTTTSSTSVTSVTTQGAPFTGDRDFGLKVSKAGTDVKTASLANMVFTSSRGVLGLRRSTTYSGITDASGNISITQPHGIGYVPITIVSYRTISTSAPNEVTVGKEVLLPITWHSYYSNALAELIEVTETTTFTLDATNIVITLHAEYYNHDTTDSGDVVGQYYYFNVYYYFNEITDS